ADDAHGDGEKHAGGLIVKLRQRLSVARRDASKQFGLKFVSRVSVQHRFGLPRAAVGQWRMGTGQLCRFPAPPPASNCTMTFLIKNDYAGNGLVDARKSPEPKVLVQSRCRRDADFSLWTRDARLYFWAGSPHSSNG